MQDSTIDAPALLALIEDAAIAASELIRARARDRAHITWREKSATDFVSDVDTSAEKLIREALLRAHPAARVLGEELSPDATASAPLAFIVDPLDGTTNFLHGYPEYAVSIAAAVRGELVAGVVIEVPTGDRFTALRGGGAFRNREPIAVSAIHEPSRALVGTGFPFKHIEPLTRYLPQFAAVARGTAGMRRAGSAALDLVSVACGHFDAFWELSLAPWDFAAGMLLVREAGGLVTTVSGGEVPLTHSSILAGNPVMHQWLATTLANATPAGADSLTNVP